MADYLRIARESVAKGRMRLSLDKPRDLDRDISDRSDQSHMDPSSVATVVDLTEGLAALLGPSGNARRDLQARATRLHRRGVACDRGSSPSSLGWGEGGLPPYSGGQARASDWGHGPPGRRRRWQKVGKR